ncbi:hypothetical protein B8W67_05220 [Mycolicibacillus koreensis]|uniref:Uncharacterized protein n=1 Tax=Mycolicibacillus koreensis TaxID=1069220 RepID=A0AA91PGI0_9MYCO|nr:hypothetical protein B8W67_05220 [Mycolicibacillus koreensis]
MGGGRRRAQPVRSSVHRIGRRRGADRVRHRPASTRGRQRARRRRGIRQPGLRARTGVGFDTGRHGLRLVSVRPHRVT